MKNLIQAVAVILFAASDAQAQQAVQWRLQDGGNGHWYRIVQRPYGPYNWIVTRAEAQAAGGDLASFETPSEWSFMRSECRALPAGTITQFLAGGQRQAGASTPWAWLTGQAFTYFAWNAGVPNDGTGEDFVLCVGAGTGGPNVFDGWDDWRINDLSSGYVIEWSADCNNDGIVDYGQCRNGTLPDYNGNNVPDCCESGTPCVVGNYPVQWRAAEGGSGHWYRWVGTSGCWSTRQSEAAAAGGHLACVVDLAELRFIQERSPGFFYLGGFRVSPVPDGDSANGWRWITGEPYNMSLYCPGWYPDNERWATGGPSANCVGESNECDGYWFVIEWSTDCNSDGIVDKGQILRGQLHDANADGVPDVCQQPTCRDADFFPDRNINGVDLGVLLSQWGMPTQYTVADLNRDGVVDGIDLGLFLSFWGPCPY